MSEDQLIAFLFDLSLERAQNDDGNGYTANVGIVAGVIAIAWEEENCIELDMLTVEQCREAIAAADRLGPLTWNLFIRAAREIEDGVKA